MSAPKRADERCGEDDVADEAQADEEDPHCRSRFSVLAARFVFRFTFGSWLSRFVVRGFVGSCSAHAKRDAGMQQIVRRQASAGEPRT